ncbi:hypothetical protein C8A05DRAFT_36352 [Staphylotrichum tortipilum]|uniref:Uncharacterized protein n=1 Tax=Staphylotrichum tortipilum TaxID=2831512 RepID=A0AAN6MFY1_9PEZI|nr:hypothetical protein C8A05DRAFT_36352 [Staphylotrichum longicolle]
MEDGQDVPDQDAEDKSDMDESVDNDEFIASKDELDNSDEFGEIDAENTAYNEAREDSSDESDGPDIDDFEFIGWSGAADCAAPDDTVPPDPNTVRFEAWIRAILLEMGRWRQDIGTVEDFDEIPGDQRSINRRWFIFLHGAAVDDVAGLGQRIFDGILMAPPATPSPAAAAAACPRASPFSFFTNTGGGSGRGTHTSNGNYHDEGNGEDHGKDYGKDHGNGEDHSKDHVKYHGEDNCRPSVGKVSHHSASQGLEDMMLGTIC